MKDLDLQQLDDIPDPFAGVAAQAPRRVDRANLAFAPTRARVRTIRLLAVVGGVLCAATWPVFIERRADLSSLPAWQVLVGVSIPLVASVLALGAAGLVRAARLESFAWVVGLVVVSPLWFALATLATSPEARDGLFWHHAAACMSVTAALAVGPLALALVAFRRAFAALSPWRAAALGVASGGIAAATMVFVCPINIGAHVMVGHGAILVVAGALAGLLGPRICRA
jgi:hypothetical protein